MKRTLFAIALVGGVLSFQYSHAQFRKYSNEFLNIGAGARGLSMGGAQVASVTDGTSAYWNPAGLVNVKDNPQLNLMHAEYFAGIGKYDYGTLVLPLKDNKRVIGISLLRFAVDDIPNTIFLVESDGTINFSNIQTFSSADYAFMFSMAQTIKMKGDRQINIGGNAKVIHRKAGDFASAWGFGFDAGLQIIDKRWRLGVMARDVTTTFNAWSFSLNEKMREVFYVTQNEIPVKSTELTAPKLIVGGAYYFNLSKSLKLMTEANLDLTFDGRRNTVISTDAVSVDPRVGLELSYRDVFFVRGGINNFQRALDDNDETNKKKIWIYQPGAGAGFKINTVQIDYAFTNLANQSNPLYTHVFSLKVDLKKKQKK
ncbi:PorV/PorQ family protein [Pseudoflavitalea sp. G-6-1-2]|uniref:putative type IX sorting system protein PorV2 n=1 Tax=Pseudoflavitalea sp. G-6-1-2 TaxID=2728841 RepID=UPI00146B8D46|nr:PorV/PorQ family protein [Pseudoflavitalea sp. G-6-1-2]NML22856.1 PorV/PorQ family protein [Pseudoflavitalea sp. G-6-1-2]